MTRVVDPSPSLVRSSLGDWSALDARRNSLAESSPITWEEVHVRRLIRVVPIAALALTAASATGAQQRRSALPSGGANIELPNIPADPRHPFAGVWVGRMMMDNDTVPIAMIIEANEGKYTGSTVLPNGAHAPHNNTAVSGNTITWQQTNSGGGLWHYDLKLSAGDTLSGKMVLHDAPNFPPPLPTVRYVLIRNPR